MTSARLPEALTRLLPPSHLTTHSAGAALAYGARLAYLASLEEDEARDAEPEPEAASAEGTQVERASVAEEPIPGSPSPARPSPRAKTPARPETPNDWESRAPEDWRSPPRETTNDAPSKWTPDAERERPERRDDAQTPVKTTETETGTTEPSFHSPPPFGAAYASSPLPSRYRADAEEERREKKNGDGDVDVDGATRKAAFGSHPNVCASPLGIVSRKHGDGDGTSPRVSLSESDKKLIETYDAMQTDFELETRGFAMKLVDETRRWFHFEDPPGVGVWPLPYTQLGLPKDCARLVVLSLVDAPAVAAAGAACAREMVKLLGPCGAACFNVSRNAYHVSVFFFSLPTDPIADPLADASHQDGDEANDANANERAGKNKNTNERDAVSVSLASAPLKRIGGTFRPSHEDEARAAEAAARETFLNSNEIVLEVDRVAQATSGALLLLFRDPNGDLRRFRDALSRHVPNAPKKQPTIAHCTLLRAFPKKSDALTSGSSGRALADVRALCARWTARVRGTRVRVDRAWLVREERFSSIDGARRAFRLGKQSEAL